MPNAFGLYMNTLMLTWEAQQVIALRLFRMAAGGPIADREAQRMVSEKMLAASEASMAAWMAMASGATAETIAKRTVSSYRGKVRANRRRLSRHS